MRLQLLIMTVLFSGLSAGSPVVAADAPAAADLPYTRTADVIYGRKYGTALTLDVFAPKANSNGAAVIWAVSGGWVSNHDSLEAKGPPLSAIQLLTSRGYTVFAVVHGSQPKYTIPEILEDMHRAVRYVRTHAADYKVDPDRFGIAGGSAGGHLSLMQGTNGTLGDAKARDVVERASSRVQAVACFYPPTDFLNYGKPGENALGRGTLQGFYAPFDFHELDRKRGFFGTLVPVTDEQKIHDIGVQISPITHVSSDDAPTLIIHGDKDALVPIQQAELIITKFKEVGVPAELVIKAGGGHGWPDLDSDLPKLVDWFDKHLQKK